MPELKFSTDIETMASETFKKIRERILVSQIIFELNNKKTFSYDKYNFVFSNHLQVRVSGCFFRQVVNIIFDFEICRGCFQIAQALRVDLATKEGNREVVDG